MTKSKPKIKHTEPWQQRLGSDTNAYAQSRSSPWNGFSFPVWENSLMRLMRGCTAYVSQSQWFPLKSMILLHSEQLGCFGSVFRGLLMNLYWWNPCIYKNFTQCNMNTHHPVYLIPADTVGCLNTYRGKPHHTVENTVYIWVCVVWLNVPVCLQWGCSLGQHHLQWEWHKLPGGRQRVSSWMCKHAMLLSTVWPIYQSIWFNSDSWR